MSDSPDSRFADGQTEPGGQRNQQQRIIVDEDWKAQVEREKREAAEKKDSQAGLDPPLPPPTLTALSSSLAMQAMAALGLLPDPLTGKLEVRLNRARHLIDTVNLLLEKTKGNISEEESRAMEEMLHELRLTYVQVQARLASQPTSEKEKSPSEGGSS